MRQKGTTLTPQELEIMKIVWDRGEATVRDAFEALLDKRPIAYTTVLTMLSVLERKGHVSKRPDGRSYVYRATKPRDQVLGSMVREFIGRVFDGSARPLLVHLLEQEQVSAEEIEEIARRAKEAS